MSCGCKNKQQTSPEAQQAVQVAKQQAVAQANEQLRESIKKTVEKYYNVNKGTTSTTKG